MKTYLKNSLNLFFIVFFITLPFLVFSQGLGPIDFDDEVIVPELEFVPSKVNIPSKPSLKDAFDSVQKNVGERAGYKTTEVDLFNVIINGIQIVLSLIGVIFIILIIYSGFSWMTAGGSDEKVTKSKTVLKNSTLGLIIILGAYSISFFVVQALSFLNIT